MTVDNQIQANMKIRITENQLNLIKENSKKDKDKVKFYKEYYKNISPNKFKVSSKDNTITIEIK